jgi:hypothetical protein
MTSIYRQQEEGINEAIQSLQGAKCTNIASLARAFSVSESRLRMRLKGRPNKLSNINAATWLTSDQNNALKTTLDRLEATGLPARIPMLTSIANQILSQSSAPNAPKSQVSHMWAPRWIKSNPDYKIAYGKPLALARKNAHNPETIREWFTNYRHIVEALQPGDISNVDETGFRVGVGRRHKVIVHESSGRVYIPDVDDRQQVTVVIQQGKTHLEKHFPPELCGDELLAMSLTGYNQR